MKIQNPKKFLMISFLTLFACMHMQNSFAMKGKMKKKIKDGKYKVLILRRRINEERINTNKLQRASQRMNPDKFIKFLAKNKNLLEVKDKQGSGIIHYSIFHKNQENAVPITLHLILEGADINIKNEDGNSPLMDAVAFKLQNDTVKLLIAAGADTKCLTPFNENLLHIACGEKKRWGARRETVLLLLALGVDKDAFDMNLQKPDLSWLYRNLERENKNLEEEMKKEKDSLEEVKKYVEETKRQRGAQAAENKPENVIE